MGVLRVLLGLVDVRLGGQVIGAVTFADGGADFRQRVVGDADRVGTHIGDEADGVFAGQLDTFIEPLGQAHGALHGETELTGGFLLQGGGDERRHRVAALLAGVDVLDDPVDSIERFDDGVRSGRIGNLEIRFVLLRQPRVEDGRLLGVELGIDGDPPAVARYPRAVAA